jgi:hypothetical protein
MARNGTQRRCADRHGGDFAIVPIIIVVVTGGWRWIIACRWAVALWIRPLIGLPSLLPALLCLLLLRLPTLLRLLSVLLSALLLLRACLLSLLLLLRACLLSLLLLLRAGLLKLLLLLLAALLHLLRRTGRSLTGSPSALIA